MHEFKYENQEMIYGGFLWAAPTQLRSALRQLDQLLVGQLTRLPYNSGYATGDGSGIGA